MFKERLNVIAIDFLEKIILFSKINLILGLYIKNVRLRDKLKSNPLVKSILTDQVVVGYFGGQYKVKDSSAGLVALKVNVSTTIWIHR